jgi:hypothetical protein
VIIIQDKTAAMVHMVLNLIPMRISDVKGGVLRVPTTGSAQNFNS